MSDTNIFKSDLESTPNVNVKLPKDIQVLIDEIKTLQQELLCFLDTHRTQLSFQELGEEYLNRTIVILEKAGDIIQSEEENNSEYGLSVLKWYIESNTDENSILGVDQLLIKLFESVEKKLSVESIKLKFSIYPPKHTTLIKEGDESSESFDLKKVQSAKKFQEFLQVLESNNISFDSLIILEEDEEILKKDKKMRNFPYRIVYLREGDIEKTILISDEIGQATFVYEGIIMESYFSEYARSEVIEGVVSEKIRYGNLYKETLQEAILTKRERSEDVDEIYVKISSNETIKDIKDKVIWRNMLLNIKDELESESGIYYIEGVWYLSETKGVDVWSDVGGKNLKNFPNAKFNKANGIGNNNGVLSNPSHLNDLFKVLGLQVATEQQEKNRWRNMLLNIKNDLENKSNIYCIKDVWYFSDAKSTNTWPRIQGRNLNSFPNTKFNTDNGIGNGNGVLSNPSHLNDLFKVLGLQVATEQQQKDRWRNMILEIENDLANKSHIHCINGIWDFSNAKGDGSWPDISSRKFKSFPNAKFNKANGIGNSDGRLTNLGHVKTLFESLGLEVEK